ncbi:MAG TPA: hypothetical protein VKU01_18095 [Bryobacteraceae bacterium]|nr:hypothetical protein [Bryobacteraceae bacterium]
MQSTLHDRVHRLNSAGFRNDAEYVLYCCRVNRRVDWNHALAYAVELANERVLPVLFYEDLEDSNAQANSRHHAFVVDGVEGTAKRCRHLGIGYQFCGSSVDQLVRSAAAVVTDDHPNSNFPAILDVASFAVDSSCIVPMRQIAKREYAAYTIRPKIHKLLPRYLRPVPELRVQRRWPGEPVIAPVPTSRDVPPSTAFRGGSDAARERLRHFLKEGLRRYAELRNQPSAHATSNLSPYLHFGHISPLEIALAASKANDFLEELIVRRELAFNFARFSADPASIANLPDWARETLQEHADDERNPLYTREQFEHAQTHDPLWNAAQKEMLLRGKIHGYYRMYWGKKILEWSRTPQEAVETMAYIHDVWALDGHDPATYANILWCLGLHDRPWPERPIFGKVRYMSFDGMKRKTDVDAYVSEIEHLERTVEDPLRL